MIKRMTIMLIAVGTIFGGLYGFHTFKAGMIRKAIAGKANPPQTISTVLAVNEDWQPQIDAVGTLRAADGADLALQVSGIVKSISFQSGGTVTTGQMLLQLAAEDDEAKLASLRATAEVDALNLARAEEQVKIKAVSQATVDGDTASLKNSQALVAQQAALVSQKTLKAPFAGRLGIRSVDVGQYLSAGSPIVTLQALDPIFVDLYLPQQDLGQVRVDQSVSVNVDTFPSERFPGKITAINPKVESDSRNVLVRASLSNADGRLLPGMFAKVSIATGVARKLVTLPQTAIVSNPYGDSVFIVDGADHQPRTVKQTFVQTGLVRGDQVAVTDGLQEGDIVVTAGQLKLRNGSPVVVDNTHVPTADPSPEIVDQ